VADACDEYLVGWAYWQLKVYKDLTTTAGRGSEGIYNSDGSLQEKKMKALRRSYMQKTAGELLRMNYLTKTDQLDAEFKPDLTIKAPSIIALSGKAEDFVVKLYVDEREIEEGKDFGVEKKGNFVTLIVRSQDLNHQIVRVIVTPKSFFERDEEVIESLY